MKLLICASALILLVSCGSSKQYSGTSSDVDLQITENLEQISMVG